MIHQKFGVVLGRCLYKKSTPWKLGMYYKSSPSHRLFIVFHHRRTVFFTVASETQKEYGAQVTPNHDDHQVVLGPL